MRLDGFMATGMPSLREGFTSGTAVSAATLAALEFFRTAGIPEYVNTPLPPFPTEPVADDTSVRFLNIPIYCAGHGVAPDSDISPLANMSIYHAGVIKDGGDDPDVTHGLLFYATIMLPGTCHKSPYKEKHSLEIYGARGIGTVTKAGLALQPGDAAINPVPRRQLHYAVNRYLSAHELSFSAPIKLFLSVPDAMSVASRTLNPKLGIVGGISILGTQGTVRPFSNKAWAQTIQKQVAYAKANGLATLCLCTGRRSESLLKSLYCWLPDPAFIQVGDLAGFTFSECRKNGIRTLVWGSFFGKLCKLAMGVANTHAREQILELKLLGELCEKRNLKCAFEVSQSLTARGALELLLKEDEAEAILCELLWRAQRSAEKYGGSLTRMHLFHEDGRELARL